MGYPNCGISHSRLSPEKTALKTTSPTLHRSTGKASRDDEVEQSRERFPKTLFALSRTGSQMRVVPETCSPVRQCTSAGGMK